MDDHATVHGVPETRATHVLIGVMVSHTLTQLGYLGTWYVKVSTEARRQNGKLQLRNIGSGCYWNSEKSKLRAKRSKKGKGSSLRVWQKYAWHYTPACTRTISTPDQDPS